MIWGMCTPLKVSISSWKREVEGKRKIVKVEREWESDEGMLNPEGLFFWLFLGKKDYSTLSFGNMVHCSIMMTRKCGIIPKLPCAYVCSCVFAQMRTRSWRVHPSDEKERRRKWKREVQQSSGHYPDSLDVWVQLQAGWYPDASPRSLLSFSLPLDLKKAE